MRKQGRIAIVPAVLLAGALVAPQLVLAEGSLHGSALDAKGEPLSDVIVKLISTDEKIQSLEVKTNKKGKFLFGVVRNGTYRLAAFKEGMRISRLKAAVFAGEDQKTWDYDGAVPPGAEMPPFSVTGVTTGNVDLVLSESLSGPGTYGTGEVLSTVDSVVQWIQAGDLEKAQREIRRNLAEKPDSAAFHYLDAYALFFLKKSDEALAAVDRALAKDPNFEGANLLRGKILEAQGKNEEAIASYRRESETAKSEQVRRDASLALAVGLEQAGKNAEAAAVLERLLEIDPGRTEIYQELAALYTQTGQKDKAQAMLAKVKELGGKQDPNILFNLGAERFNQKDYDGAAGYFRQAIEANPDMAEAHLHLGYCALNLGDTAGAINSLERYLQLQPNGQSAEDARQILAAIAPKKK